MFFNVYTIFVVYELKKQIFVYYLILNKPWKQVP
jgi:hypothetical protein